MSQAEVGRGRKLRWPVAPMSKPVRVLKCSMVELAKVNANPDPGNYAVVDVSGQQFWLQPNRYYNLDRLQADVDSTVTFNKVLLVRDEGGTTLGKPYVRDAKVELKVMAHRRSPKIVVYKMRPKKKTRRKSGHRQELTRVMVQCISINGKVIS